MRIIVKQVRGRKKAPNWKGIVEYVRADMGTEIKDRAIKYPERVVANWDHKPGFKTRFVATRDIFALDIWPTGPNAKYWVWGSRGTPKRTIKPKKPGGVLAFPSTYTPKTRPRGPSYGGPGVSSGPMVFTKLVKNHQIRPRKWEEAWARWMKPWYSPTLEKAIKRGARRA